MANFQDIATQFVQFYYQTFDSDRTALAPLYRPHSMLTFESSATQGVAQIVEKLTSLPFTEIQHKTDTIDAQPSSDAGGVLVLVTGQLMTGGEARPMSFVQTFQLLPDNGTYYVYNDVFKLVYPA